MLISIAWKNIWRNKLRSAVVIIAVTLGLIGGIMSVGIMFGSSDQRIKDALNDYVSEIQIHHPKYSENNEAKYIIKNSDNAEKIISEIPGVKSVCSRMKIIGMANSPEAAVGIVINGINPEREKKVTDIYTKIPDSLGTYFKNTKRNPVLISSKLAEKLNLHLRSKVVLTFQEKNGTMTGGAFRVSGIYKTNNSMFDETNIFVKKEDLARLTLFPENTAHEIAVRITDKKQLETIKADISKKYPDLSVMTWKELQPDLAMVTDFMNQMMAIFMIIILSALGFGIVNTMLMVVLERIKEIGMLMAVGMNRIRVFTMIMLETVFLSVVGGGIGMAVSAILLNYFGRVGMSFSSVSKGLESFGYSAVIFPKVETSFYFMLSFLIILTGIIASVYPAIKAVKLNPAEAVRTDA
ncbi:MAG: FtsX-like permease family protein [Bacteroidales bacterium]|nr:FtsX-like permease family protein [Bacteroidales bacterium]